MANGNTLLTYAPATAPSPLQVSPSLTEPSVATVTIVVSCPPDTDSANVAQLMLTLSVRDPDAPDSSELAMVPPPAGSAAIVSTGSDRWVAAPGLAPGVFTFTPLGGPVAVSSQALTITFTGIEISPLVGTTAIAISEWASSTGAAPPTSQPPSGTDTIVLTKFPVGFFVTSFTGPAEVDSGSTVTLTWEGTSTASYAIDYGQQHVQVSGQSWTSPPLYGDTVFKLTASATQNGQTVTTPQTTMVEVASPVVVSFQPLPEQVGVGQPMVLTWITNSADGVYFLSTTGTGATKHEKTWPALSDSGNPVTFTPMVGVSYALQAYKKAAGGGEVKSEPYPLDFGYLPVAIKFSADPQVVSDVKPNTLLSWDVANATAVTLQGAAVGARGSRPDTPKDDTTYTLIATAVDGSQTTQTASVTSRKIMQTSYETNIGDVQAGLGNVGVYLDIWIEVAAVSSVVLDPITFFYGQVVELSATARQAAPRQWNAQTSFAANAIELAVLRGTNQVLQADILVDGQRVPGVRIPQR